jgi:hypothetical protein
MHHPDADLETHRSRYSFYYERASPLELGAMDALCSLHICVTLAVHGNRNLLHPEVLAALEKTTDVVEAQFMEVCGVIRTGPAFAALTDGQRAAMESGCLTVPFLE